jgi:mycoredoxin
MSWSGSEEFSTAIPGAGRGVMLQWLTPSRAEAPCMAKGLYNRSMDLTLYSAFWCPDCREAKRFLAKHNIPYKEIDIEFTPGAAEEVIRNTGKRAIPQFVIDGEWVQPYRPGEGFLHEEMSERLGVKGR